MTTKTTIRAGDTVRVRKGSTILSTYERLHGEARRGRRVKVHRVDRGTTFMVGEILGSRVDMAANKVSRWLDGITPQALGDLLDLLDCVTKRTDLDEVLAMDHGPYGVHVDVLGRIHVRLTPITVVWAGSGGYWCWTEISNCEPLGDDN